MTDVDPVVYQSRGVFTTCYSSERCDQLAVTFATGPAPARPATVITIHGGNFDSGDRTDLAAMTPQFTAAGYPVIEIDYSLTAPGQPGFPQAVRDVQRVVDWVHTVGAPTYGLPDSVVVLGISAGANLALMAAYAPGDGFFTLDPGNYRVDAVISCWAPSDLETLNLAAVRDYLGAPSFPYAPEYNADLASPLHYVGLNVLPPTLLLHGVMDATVPVAQTDALNEALNAAGVYHHYYRNPTGTHSATSWGGLAAIADYTLQFIPTLLAERSRTVAQRDLIVNQGDRRIVFGDAATIAALTSELDTGVLFTGTSVANGAGRVSTVVDLEAIFGKLQWPERWSIESFTKVQTATVGNVISQYIAYAAKAGDTLHQDGGLGLVDAAVTVEADVLACRPFGSPSDIYCRSATASVEFARHSDILIAHPRFSVAWWNRSGAALSATAADHGIIMRPIPNRISDGSV